MGKPSGGYIAVVVSVVLFGIGLHQRCRQRLLADLPTSKAQGVFIGLVELKGTAESAAPLRSFLSEAPCVHYSYHVEERWSRIVTETVTDDDGKRQTRTRYESGWTTVDSGDEIQDFYVRDETGVVLVRPKEAKLEPTVTLDETVSHENPRYYGKGPAAEVFDSDHRRRFFERAIVLHAPLYIVWQARERRDVLAPDIRTLCGGARVPDFDAIGREDAGRPCTGFVDLLALRARLRSHRGGAVGEGRSSAAHPVAAGDRSGQLSGRLGGRLDLEGV